MRRGTTPTITFTLPFETDGVVKDLRVSFAQDNETVIEKQLSDCELDGSTISVYLTQEDTLEFKEDRTAKIQVKIITCDGKVLASIPVVVDCLEIINEEVLT